MNPINQRDLAKAMLAAGQPGVCQKPNKEPIRIQFRFRQPAGPLQDGNLHGETIAMDIANAIYGSGESSGVVWCPGLERKCIQIFGEISDLNAHPVVIQANIRGSDLKGNDWVTISTAITAAGIYPIAVAAASAIPFMFEPEITLLRIIAVPVEIETPATLPTSIEAVFSGYWGGEGKWVMRCVNSYEGM